jgi:hypothetical protein
VVSDDGKTSRGSLTLSTAASNSASGDVSISSGTSTGTSVGVSIFSGKSTNASGYVTIASGASNSSTGGDVSVTSGSGTKGGAVTISVGEASNGASNVLSLSSGKSTKGLGGDVTVLSGSGSTGGGSVSVSSSSAVQSGPIGNVNVVSGDSSSGASGDVIVSAGSGVSGGKLQLSATISSDNEIKVISGEEKCPRDSEDLVNVMEVISLEKCKESTTYASTNDKDGLNDASGGESVDISYEHNHIIITKDRLLKFGDSIADDPPCNEHNMYGSFEDREKGFSRQKIVRDTLNKEFCTLEEGHANNTMEDRIKQELPLIMDSINSIGDRV